MQAVSVAITDEVKGLLSAPKPLAPLPEACDDADVIHLLIIQSDVEHQKKPGYALFIERTLGDTGNPVHHLDAEESTDLRGPH